MSLTQSRHPQRLRLIGLLIIMLAGLQVVQASPLHDHLQHAADCLLCHHGALDEPVQHSGLLLTFAVVTGFESVGRVDAPRTAEPAPYQGRAPPRHISA